MHRDYLPIFLSPEPIGKSVGDMSDDEPLLSWTQSPDQYLGIIVRHSGTYRLNGRPYEFRPYDFLLATPGSRCDIERRGEPPYEYVFFNFQFGRGSGDPAWIPVCRSVSDGEFWYRSFVRAARRISISMGMFRAVVPAFIWSLVEFGPPPSKNVYVADAERIITERLAQTIRVSELAEEIGISQSQLTRQFILETGATPMQYILERRAELAHRLLTTTKNPFKDVARSCGFPDTHSFSRFVRGRLGASPRHIRSRQSNSL